MMCKMFDILLDHYWQTFWPQKQSIMLLNKLIYVQKVYIDKLIVAQWEHLYLLLWMTFIWFKQIIKLFHHWNLNFAKDILNLSYIQKCQSRQLHLRAGIHILQFSANLTIVRNHWKKQILKMSAQFLFLFRFYGVLNFSDSPNFSVFSNFLEFKDHLLLWASHSLFPHDMPKRLWETGQSQRFRLPWENFMGIQISKKMPKFHQKSMIFEVFFYGN